MIILFSRSVKLTTWFSDQFPGHVDNPGHRVIECGYVRYLHLPEWILLVFRVSSALEPSQAEGSSFLPEGRDISK